MRKHRILLVVLTSAMILGPAFARSRYRRRPSPPPRPSPVKSCLEEIGVTAEQMELMDAIRRAAVELLKEAQSRQEARDIIEQMREDIRAVLTPEQLEALKECLRPDKPVTCMDQIGLSAEQIEAIDAIRQAALEEIREAESPKQVRDIVEQMHQAIEDVLTDEQLEALRQCLRPQRPVNCMDQIGLTPEQVAAIDAIRQAALEDLKDARGPREVRAILDQMYEDTMAVLTDEQLEALQECRDAQRNRQRKTQ